VKLLVKRKKHIAHEKTERVRDLIEFLNHEKNSCAGGASKSRSKTQQKRKAAGIE
jgi:hypothetical protein